MDNDMKSASEKKKERKKEQGPEESAQRALAAFTKLWWNLNIVSSVTK